MIDNFMITFSVLVCVMCLFKFYIILLLSLLIAIYILRLLYNE